MRKSFSDQLVSTGRGMALMGSQRAVRRRQGDFADDMRHGAAIGTTSYVPRRRFYVDGQAGTGDAPGGQASVFHHSGPGRRHGCTSRKRHGSPRASVAESAGLGLVRCLGAGGGGELPRASEPLDDRHAGAAVCGGRHRAACDASPDGPWVARASFGSESSGLLCRLSQSRRTGRRVRHDRDRAELHRGMVSVALACGRDRPRPRWHRGLSRTPEPVFQPSYTGVPESRRPLGPATFTGVTARLPQSYGDRRQRCRCSGGRPAWPRSRFRDLSRMGRRPRRGRAGSAILLSDRACRDHRRPIPAGRGQQRHRPPVADRVRAAATHDPLQLPALLPGQRPDLDRLRHHASPHRLDVRRHPTGAGAPAANQANLLTSLS